MPEFLLISILCLYFITIVYSIKIKDFLNPVHIYTGSLSISYIVYFFYYYKYLCIPQLQTQVYILLLMGIISFFIGYFYFEVISCFVPSKRKYRVIKELKPQYRIYIKIFIFLGLIGFLINLIQSFKFGISGPTNNWLFNLRYATTVLRYDYNGKYLFLFYQIATIFCIIYRKQWGIKSTKIIIMILLWVISSMFTVARTNLLLCLLSTSSAWFFSNRYLFIQKKINYKPIITAGLVFFLFFFIVAVATNKIKGGMINTFLAYLGYPLIAFNDFIFGNPGISNGKYVFYPIIKTISIINNDSTLMTSGQVFIPSGEFNVFTMLQGPYMDFGYYGVFWVPLLIGMVYWFIYFNVRSRNGWVICYYSLLLFPLALSFYAYTFGYVSWVYYLIIILLLRFVPNVLHRPVR